MARAGSRWGFTGQASKQLAGEWESFKRQGEEEILIQPCISQWRSHFYNLFTVSLALTNTGSQSALSHFTQDNFLKAAVGKRGNGEGKRRRRRARRTGRNLKRQMSSRSDGMREERERRGRKKKHRSWKSKKRGHKQKESRDEKNRYTSAEGRLWSSREEEDWAALCLDDHFLLATLCEPKANEWTHLSVGANESTKGPSQRVLVCTGNQRGHEKWILVRLPSGLFRNLHAWICVTPGGTFTNTNT